MAATDEHLLARTASDPEAMRELVARHSGDLHRYVARRLGLDVAEDVVSEVFLTAFRKRADFDRGLGTVRPWLFGIATTLIHRHRRVEARRLHALERATAVATGPAIEIVEPVSATERAALCAALTRMRPEYRDVLFLSAVAEFTMAEIASVLRVPENTVKTWLHRARAVAAESITAATTTAALSTEGRAQ